MGRGPWWATVHGVAKSWTATEHILLFVGLLRVVSNCDPMDCSPPGSSIHGILQARILEWVSMPSSKGSSQPRDQNMGLFHLLHCWVFFLVVCLFCFLPLESPRKPNFLVMFTYFTIFYITIFILSKYFTPFTFFYSSWTFSIHGKYFEGFLVPEYW